MNPALKPDERAIQLNASALAKQLEQVADTLDRHPAYRSPVIRQAAGFLRAIPFPAWQPIETAPKDGTPFLAFETAERGPFKCWWHDEWHYAEHYWMDHQDSEPNPTHWQPALPEPPQP